MIYLGSWDYNSFSFGVWWCIGLVSTYFLGLLVCETELGFKHRYKREIQDQYCLVYGVVSHGAPIQGIRVLANHTHGLRGEFLHVLLHVEIVTLWHWFILRVWFGFPQCQCYWREDDLHMILKFRTSSNIIGNNRVLQSHFHVLLLQYPAPF